METLTGMSDAEVMQIASTLTLNTMGAILATSGGDMLTSPLKNQEFDGRFAPYKFNPKDYIRDFHGGVLWSAQEAIIDNYTLVLRQLHERHRYDKGLISKEDLKYWQPGELIKIYISIDAGHTVGKTYLLSKITQHFHDCFSPAITYCFAPVTSQIRDLLFKEIRGDRVGRTDLRGKVYEGNNCRIQAAPNHFVVGKGLDKSHGNLGEKIHGQHEENLLFIIDEAEAVPTAVFDSIKSMTGGSGISLVVIARNPKTTSCKAHKIRSQSNCTKFTISCLDHPNVIEGREVVPSSVTRHWINEMLDSYCETVNEHNVPNRTFEVPWRPGIIYKPRLEFLWRVLGITDSSMAGDTFCAEGWYDVAEKREPPKDTDETFAYIGIDCAGYGYDNGTIYVFHAGTLERRHLLQQVDGYEYYIKAKEECERLFAIGVRHIQVRIDGGGGYGSTPISNLRRDTDLIELFGDDNFKIIQVLNNNRPSDKRKFKDKVTEMYFYAGQAMEDIALINPPSELKADLCERKYVYVNVKSRAVKQLTPKERFRKKHNRSPDDGDGAVLALAPKFIFSTEILVGSA